MPTNSSDSSAAGASQVSNERDAEYRWEIRRDDRVVDQGRMSLDDEHPWTGDVADNHFEVGSAFFEQACYDALERSRDAILDARVEGRPEPEPVGMVSVLLQDDDGTALVSMTAKLTHKPVTAEDVAEHRALLQECEEEDRRMLEARKRQQAES
ncbi:hypothetical protein [Nocardia terpenica]|uniref:Uncharacterized protein n=1 Tax=Nocardia terpenica TaxID=455432 RepID=A0A6G9YZM8_9NOCA|nr:hypothetical protein [Nocardia terpenica]QIS18799.1 hypothetical protein F6W96_11340 [Nocardia terpenica]